VIRFGDGPGILEELEELAAAERQCCAFAKWRVIRGPQFAELRIRSTAEGLEAIAALTSRFDLLSGPQRTLGELDAAGQHFQPEHDCAHGSELPGE
jgi:hypothetical protein